MYIEELVVMIPLDDIRKEVMEVIEAYLNKQKEFKPITWDSLNLLSNDESSFLVEIDTV